MNYFFLLNKYLHDLFTSFFFVSSLILILCFKLRKEEIIILKNRIIPFLFKIFWFSIFLTIITGFPRVYYFLNYEIKPEVKKEWTEILITKHLFLVFLVLVCFLVYFKFKSFLKKAVS